MKSFYITLVVALALVLGLLMERTVAYSRDLINTDHPSRDIAGYLPPVSKDRVDPELFKRNRERTRSAVVKVRLPVSNRKKRVRPSRNNRATFGQRP